MPATLLLTEELGDALADAVRRGVPIETAAQAAGLSPRSAYEWLKVAQTGTWHDGSPASDHAKSLISAFSEKIRRAEAEWEAAQVIAIGEAGEAVGKNGIPEWRARFALLQHHPRSRARWGQHLVVEQTGTVLHEHTMAKQLDDDALEHAYHILELPTPTTNND